MAWFRKGNPKPPTADPSDGSTEVVVVHVTEDNALECISQLAAALRSAGSVLATGFAAYRSTAAGTTHDAEMNSLNGVSYAAAMVAMQSMKSLPIGTAVLATITALSIAIDAYRETVQQHTEAAKSASPASAAASRPVALSVGTAGKKGMKGVDSDQ